MNLKKLLVFLLVGVMAITSLVGCTSKTDLSKVDEPVVEDNNDSNDNVSKEEAELLVSAAASLTDVLEEIKDLYKSVEPETNLTFTLGSSGALQTQIEEGAPVDVFMSAAQKQMDALEEKNLLADDTRKTLLVNKVVLITPKDSKLEFSSFEDMTKDDVRKIAVGDPANVPVGQYSEEIFNNLKIADKVNDRLVLGSDVRTVLTWVESGEVDCGLVYATDAMSSDQVNIITEAPEGSHKEVSYPVAVIKDSKNVDRGQAFLNFLSTDGAIKTFEKYGFSMK